MNFSNIPKMYKKNEKKNYFIQFFCKKTFIILNKICKFIYLFKLIHSFFNNNLDYDPEYANVGGF